MTSRARPTKKISDPALTAPRATGAGFTLLEMILAMALVVLLAGLALGSLWGTLGSMRTKEHSSRIASLLRAARAEAANTGCRLRLSFDPETTQPILSIERDPLGEPGAFEPLDTWWVKLAALDHGVRVLLCERTGASDFVEVSAQTAPAPGGGDEAELAEVTFYPDGSSDSVRIVLGNDDEDKPWMVEVTLNGVDGSIKTRQIDEEDEDYEEERPR